MDIQEMRDLLARKVMGWHEGDFQKTWIESWEPIGLPAVRWRPDKDWEQCGMVIEAMREKGYACEVSDLGEEGIMACCFSPDDYRREDWSSLVTAATEPFARMMAVARALEGDDGGNDVGE